MHKQANDLIQLGLKWHTLLVILQLKNCPYLFVE